MFFVLCLLVTTVVLSASIMITGFWPRQSHKGNDKDKVFVNPFEE